MACEPTTDLDDQGAAGDRLGAPADGGRGMDSRASGANHPAAPSADEIERIVQSRHDLPYRVLGPQPARGGQLVEADTDEFPEERRRFALINIPRHLFSRATAEAAKRKNERLR